MTTFAVPADPSSGLICRLLQDKDIPGILELWESESGWGGLTAEMWKAWYRATPHGDAIVTVTVDGSDRVVGQMVFTPAVVRIEGVKVPAYRMSAPILASSLRTIGVWKATHPFTWMYFTGVNEAIARGGHILYAFPAYKWLAVWGKWKADGSIAGRPLDREFGCLSLRVPEGERQVARSTMNVAHIAQASSEHERLWDLACSRRPDMCRLERSLEWLRYNRGEGMSLEARRVSDGALAAYAVVKRDGLLSDFFVADRAETAVVLESIVSFLSDARAAGVEGVGALSIMETPEIGPAARALGATDIDFRFAFICSLLSDAVPETALGAESWQIMPGD